MVSGILLAAGMATRLGSNKMLLELNGRKLIQHGVETALASRLEELIVVVGHEAERVRRALRGFAVTIVYNENYAQGQSTSLRAGLGAVSSRAKAALILLGDQPRVSAHLIDRLLATYEITGAPIVAPAYQGERGNPVLFDRSLFPELLAVSGDQGGREVVARHRERMVTVPLASPDLTLDVDTWEDYQRLVSATVASQAEVEG